MSMITEQNKQEILDPLDVSKIWGIGKVTERKLKSIGINTIEELRSLILEELDSSPTFEEREIYDIMFE